MTTPTQFKSWVRKALEGNLSAVAIAKASRVHVGRVRRVLEEAGIVNEGSRRHPKWVARKAKKAEAKTKDKNGVKRTKKRAPYSTKAQGAAGEQIIVWRDSVGQRIVEEPAAGTLSTRFIKLVVEGRNPRIYEPAKYQVFLKFD